MSLTNEEKRSRQERQLAEGSVAMADYRAIFQASIDSIPAQETGEVTALPILPLPLFLSTPLALLGRLLRRHES